MNTFTLPTITQLQVVLLNKEHISQIMQLREKVLATLIHKDCYIREQDEYKFIEQHCGTIGETFGIFAENDLIAYASLGYQNVVDEENLGGRIGLPPTQYSKVSQLASCMVSPYFQGLGLHKLLIKKRIAQAHTQGYPHCLSLVSPRNIPSRRNFFHSGFQIYWAGNLPGLSAQHILYYNTQQSVPTLDTHLSKQVGITDIRRQQQLLQQGYYGYADSQSADTILFAPLSY